MLVPLSLGDEPLARFVVVEVFVLVLVECLLLGPIALRIFLDLSFSFPLLDLYEDVIGSWDLRCWLRATSFCDSSPLPLIRPRDSSSEPSRMDSTDGIMYLDDMLGWS